ncbi:MAG: glycosyltransferase, partial [Nitrospinaceae bacterium]|nr:glycosyltransferase family 4 protein [Nitrospinaceae bacterium]NIR55651.1 glycosyltransferase family 4 protein [Nitrospinaceae bacterium]NIS86093.1 glycosyltransferase family 4 protein [Nitrospinaceae bacterium]NIT82937.1 glycosyltransferase family 4 protein [Nitrospinaceae bacterium]NIU45140.1 glycosyltransferase family 4 protein [Nitrospinaceae bacterium]
MASRPNTLTILSLQYHTAPDERGGAWGLTWEVNKHLVRRGHAVFCITCKPVDALPASEVLEGVRFERIRVSASKNFFHLWRAVRRRIHRLLEETDIDLVHIHNPLIGFFAVLNKRLRNVPKVYHFHSSWVDEERVNRLAAAEEP